MLFRELNDFKITRIEHKLWDLEEITSNWKKIDVLEEKVAKIEKLEEEMDMEKRLEEINHYYD